MSSTYPRQNGSSLKEILRNRRLALNRSSCLPCRERKVKCNKASPCATCVKRGHSDLCTYIGSRASHEPLEARETESPSTPMPQQDDIPSVSSSSTAAGSTLFQDNSMVTVARGRSPQGASNARRTAFETGILPLLGASDQDRPSNSSVIPPTISNKRLEEQQVFHLFEIYRSRVHPFHFIVYDLDQVERDLCRFFSTGQRTDANMNSEACNHIQWFCLVHGILASAAQFSDFQPDFRAELSQTHLRYAFDALRAAQYLAKPSKYAVQALHLLGSVLQNDMKPQAAWVLGGTTIRLAQCLGLHKGIEMSAYPNMSRQEASFLRRSITWQDSLLSLAFDRPPASHEMDYEQDLPELTPTINGRGLTYHQAMNWMCHKSLRYMSWERISETRPSPLSLLRDLEQIQQALSLHLQDLSASASLQDIREYYAFQLHLNFSITYFCRPIIAGDSFHSLSMEDKSSIMSQLRESLKVSARAYLKFRTVALYARRSWASIHNGLASVLLLSLMKETRATAETRQLQDELINSIAHGEMTSGSELGATSVDQLSDTHKKALGAIKKLRQLSEHDAFIAGDNTTFDNAAPRQEEPSAHSLGALYNTQESAEMLDWDLGEWLQPFGDEISSLGAFDFIMADQSTENDVPQMFQYS